MPEKYDEAARLQLYNQKEKATSTYLAQMASTVACHIVLSQGCAAVDLKKTLFVGPSAFYTESVFKHTLVR